MSKSDTWEYQILDNVFAANASTILATAGTSSLWVGGHTADPGDASSTANEGGYSAYTRVQTTRGADWVVSSGTGAAVASVSPAANIDFPQQSSAGTQTWTHASVWLTSNGGSSDCLYNGTITPNITLNQNVTPRLTTGSSITED